MEIVAPYLLIPFGILLILGIPVSFALGLACVIFLFFSGTTIPPLILITEMFTAVNQFALLALPMFVLTGELLNRCDITEKLVEVARLMVGWLKGGLAHVNILTSMFFAGISGSVLADAASLGPILIPAMIRERYPPAFSAAVTAASAVIGAIIPPSTVAIIIGGQLQISIGGLFAGGIIPGILIGLALMITAGVISARRGYGDVHTFKGVIPIAKGSARAAPALLIPFIILGGILGGIFTPTEAGAIAVLYTLIIGTFYYRTLDLRNLIDAMIGTAKVTASALVIVSTAIVFSRILTFFKIPQEILELLIAISDNRVIMALILIGFFLIMGTFMDALANMIILGPLLMPVAIAEAGLGMTEIQYGLFLMISLLLGLITPPLGLLLFITGPIAKVSLERVSLAIIPFLFAELVVLLLIVFVPAITMAIPRALGLGG
jgi:tripartite ATP-independent transporter DctM subunit